mgnify:FL=1
MEGFTDRQLQEIQALLLEKKAQLEQQLRDAEAATGVVTLDQTAVGRVSRVDAMQQQSMAVSTLRKAEASLRKVIGALRRIDAKDYGYCSNCDRPIEFKRLEVQPQASHCLICQDQLDQA